MNAAQKHNLVEKKRREKISQKFDELKSMIELNENDKITQYDILNETIEYIKSLREQNDEYKSKLENNVKKEDQDIKKITKKIKNTII
jgi:hypothetical protein